MSSGSIKRDDSTFTPTTITKPLLPQPQIFVDLNGIKKRKIYYNVDFTEEEESWIRKVRSELRQQRGIQIREDQVILRFCYAADFNMQKALEKLEEYHKWFTNPKIQCLTPTTFSIFRDGFTYSYGTARDGRPFIIMNITVLNIENYGQDGYYQAVNHTINKALKTLIPGYMESYYYLIDMNEQLLSLPISLLGDVIKKIGNAYSGMLEKLMILNCTMVSKWIFNRLRGFGVISQSTANRISFFTKEDLQKGELLTLIHEDVLEKKYGGQRPDIDHRSDCVYKSDEKVKINEVFEEPMEESNRTQYFSIQDIEEHAYYKQGGCCGDSEDCIIY